MPIKVLAILIQLELYDDNVDMNCPFSMQVGSPTHGFNKRSLDSLIAGLQSLQQCEYSSKTDYFKVIIMNLVPISDGGEYTVQINEDTDIPLDGSATFYISTYCPNSIKIEVLQKITYLR